VAEANLLTDAEQALVVDCMRRLGFHYWRNPRVELPEYREFPYVVDDIRWAHRHGYGSDLQARLDASMAKDRNEQYIMGLPSARRAALLAALNGVPSDDPRKDLTAVLPSGTTVHRSRQGCQSQAQERLYGDLSGWFQASRAMDDLVGMRYRMVYEAEAFKTALSVWSRCMRRAGLHVTTPAEARASVAPGVTGAARGNGRREITVAVAEANCANSTVLAATARDLDGRYQQLLRERYRRDFTTWRALRLSALPRARAALHR
jgi:hypothetical protein